MDTNDLNVSSNQTISNCCHAASRIHVMACVALMSIPIAGGVRAEGTLSKQPPAFGSEDIQWTSRADNVELAQMRGGLSVAGVEIDLGARIRTLINGQQALESQFELSDRGLRPVESLSVQASQQGAADRAQQVVSVATGTVRVANRVSESGIVSFLTIDASGQSLRHELAFDVTIQNFSALQRSFRAASLAAHASRSVRP